MPQSQESQDDSATCINSYFQKDVTTGYSLTETKTSGSSTLKYHDASISTSRIICYRKNKNEQNSLTKSNNGPYI